MKHGLKLVAMFLTILGWTAISAQDTLVLDKIVAKVGGEVVFHSDVEDNLSPLRERKAAITWEDRCVVFESLLAQGMLVHYARIDSVEVSDAEVNAQIDAKMEQILAYMNNDRKLFHDFYGKTVSEMSELAKEPTMRQLLAERMQAQIMNNVITTPAEVQDYFNSIPKDSLPYFNAEVELAEIVIFPKVNEEERAKAMAKINDIRDQLNNGGDFATLARKYSDDGSAYEGGELGWTKRGAFVPEFEAAAFQLTDGQTSDIVETEFGFHIIQLIDRKANDIKTRHILVRPRITEADREKTRMLLDSVKQLIMVDSITFAEAVKEYGDERVQSHSNNGRMINPKTANTFFETGDVDSEIFFAIDTLDIGEITAPLEYRTGVNDYYYKIVQLQSRSAPHRASLQQDYNRIQAAARESKRSRAFSDWVSKRIDTTYIVIDPDYDQCVNLEAWRTQ
jgi:peptidyl-prolyl cis-trans isomerase SurA